MYLARSYSNINKIKTQRKAVILGLFFQNFAIKYWKEKQQVQTKLWVLDNNSFSVCHF